MQARGKWWITLLLLATLGGCGRDYTSQKEKAAKKKAADRKKVVHEHLVRQQRELMERSTRTVPK